MPAERRSVPALPLALALALAGCSVYEPPPGAKASDAGATDASGGGDAPAADTPDAAGALRLAEHCTDSDLPLAVSSEESIPSSLRGYDDDLRDFPGCRKSPELPGPDGFLRVAASAGERWYIEVVPEEERLDLALYLMPECDGDTCEMLVDDCGPGVPEELTFVADAAGDHLLGIDTAGEGGDFHILTRRANCGDGVIGRGEACDDGNSDDGDGCDSECRVELAGSSTPESEPNDRPASANVLRFGGQGGSVQVSGALGGPCDTDGFAIHVPNKTSLIAIMKDGDEEECDDGHPAVSMRLEEGVTGAHRGYGSAGGEGGACPSIELGRSFNEDLPAGEYRLVTTAGPEQAAFDYVLELIVVRNHGP